MKNHRNKTLQIALLGYGKMGHEIEALALKAGHKIAVIIDKDLDWQKREKDLAKADVAIDFSQPETAVANIERCFKQNVPIVVGTTGWYAQFEDIRKKCVKQNQSLFYASNFSLGVNLFSVINKKLAHIMNRFPEYDLSMTETHHTQKLDAPSGTAIRLAEEILSEIDRKNSWELRQESKKHKDSVLPIEALRIAHVPGIHEVCYSSDVDKITISHEALNRKGFAKGALLAAAWVIDKKGVFNMQDLLDL
jgi:4-hydroxy-tetrahydrodipicolinate reductase